MDHGQSRSSEKKSQGNKRRPGKNQGRQDEEFQGQEPRTDGKGVGPIFQDQDGLPGEEVAVWRKVEGGPPAHLTRKAEVLRRVSGGRGWMRIKFKIK